jgi:hypothetical protein
MSTAFARAYAAAFTGKTNGSECVMRGYDCPICGKQERWTKSEGWSPCACPEAPRRIKTDEEQHHDEA